MKGIDDGLLALFIAIAAALVLVYVAVTNSSYAESMKKEAIERGYAEWVINPPDGSTTWQWKEQTE